MLVTTKSLLTGTIGRQAGGSFPAGAQTPYHKEELLGLTKNVRKRIQENPAIRGAGRTWHGRRPAKLSRGRVSSHKELEKRLVPGRSGKDYRYIIPVINYRKMTGC